MKQSTIATLVRVFRRPSSIVVILVVGWLVLTAAVVIVSYETLALAWRTSQSWSDLFLIGLASYETLGSSLTTLGTVSIVAASGLAGLYAALLVSLWRRQGMTRGRSNSLGAVGIISAFFGVGCAACGSIIATSLLSLVGAGGVFALIPYGGEAFSLLALGLLVYANYTLVRALQMPPLCDPTMP